MSSVNILSNSHPDSVMDADPSRLSIECVMDRGAEAKGDEALDEMGSVDEQASTSRAGCDPDLSLYRDNESAHNLYLSAIKATAAGLGGPPAPSSLDDLALPSESSSIRSNSSRSDPDDVDYSILDRYGFIVVKHRDRTETGGTEDGEEKSLKERQERQGRKEARRAIKWVDMLKVLEAVSGLSQWPKSHRKFESRLVKGIPECLRMKVWAQFMRVPLAVSPSPNYRELYLKISGFERQIDLDIERTLRDHILFKARFSSAQVSLFKILVAYSNVDPEVGYCQGMSTIAAFLLLYFEEEMAFNMLKRLMDRDGLRSLFTAGFPLLFETFFVQEQLMKRHMSALYVRLESLHITSSVYATKWYLTLFLGFPFSLATRLWDLFLYWGLDMLICASLALLKMHEQYLLTLSYESSMQFLSKLPETPIDEKRLVRTTWMIWRRIHPHYLDQEERKSPFQALRVQYGKLSAKKA